MATGRNRSGTLVSQLSSQLQMYPVQSKDSVNLQASIHVNGIGGYPNVLLNRDWWKDVQNGDVIELKGGPHKESCVFVLEPTDPVGLPPNIQVSISQDVAKYFELSAGTEVTLTKIRPEKYAADVVEVYFSDQYLGRPDMWRLSSSLVGKCWHTEQRVQFVGCISAVIKHLFIKQREVKAAFVTPETKVIYRSLTAKCTIFIQVCRELWDFADDGERYYEKVVHSFLPTLFKKWKELSTRHVLTIVLMSRVFYDPSDVDYAAGPVQRDEDGRDYKDFFKVVTDIEVLDDDSPTLNTMKESLLAFQRDILLTHHYHHHEGKDQPPRLVGQLSYANDGPILEAINLGLNPTESHYIDRSLSLTGSSTILITPGKGHFRVSKKLLKLTTTRLLDQGFGLDVIALGKAPLHATPLFSFYAIDPSKYIKEGTSDDSVDRDYDVLWGGPVDNPPPNAGGDPNNTRKIIYWQPFWIFLMFWDFQMDLPFREDQYVPRARMPQFESMGLLDYDLYSAIAIPPLDTSGLNFNTTPGSYDHFDQNVFSSAPTSTLSNIDSLLANRNTGIKSSTQPSSLGMYKSNNALRHTPSLSSLNASARPTKQTRTDSLEEEQLPRRSRPNSAQLDEATKERLAMSIPGTSPKTGRLSAILTQAERRIRPAPQSLTMSEASSSNLTRKVSTRTKSPDSSRRDSSVPGTSEARKEGSSDAGQLPTPSKPAEKSDILVPRKSSGNTDKKSGGGLIPFGRITSSWLFTPWKINVASPTKEITPVVASTTSSTGEIQSRKAPVSESQPNHSTTQPLAIKETSRRLLRMKNADEGNLAPGQRLSATRGSPLSASPAETPNMGTSFRNSTGSGLIPQNLINPSASEVPVLKTQSALARRWEHIHVSPTFETEIKWKSMLSPGCLPLTTGYFPTKEELEKAYSMHFYDITLGPEMSESFLVKRPVEDGPISEEKWALSILRVMVALRLAQGFQFVLLTEERAKQFEGFGNRPIPRGPSEILNDVETPVLLSMSDQIHRLIYDPTGPTIRVERFVRRSASVPPPIPYRCLIWPKRGGGYTECNHLFKSPQMELYGWNRLDMLSFGYEQQFNESLRYWRTRFIVIPTEEKPEQRVPKGGKPLSDEEIRLNGIEKLAEHFTRSRWLKKGESLASYPPVRFLPTTLDPVASLNDDLLMNKLEELHEAGPLRKRPNSNRTIENSANDLMSLASLMRQPGGVPIRDNRWHHAFYQDSFTGEEFVSWLLREFQDVSTREQGAEWGSKLEQKGFLKHCRGYHGFIDGHYYYEILSPYQNKSAPRPPLPYSFTKRILRNPDDRSTSGNGVSRSSTSPRKNDSPRQPGPGTKRRILSESMIIDVDLQKKSSQSETAILHYDVIQNPATAFHFQLHWVGTSAKFIDDTVQTWSRAVERYGLRLIEAYVDQVTDITKTNVFQSCFPIEFAVPPPAVPSQAGVQPDYFEGCLLRQFDYVLDICSSEHYGSQAEVIYSYRNSPFTFSQYVHKSGLAFAQVIEGKGFRWLTNRLATIRQMSMHDQPRGLQDRPNQLMDKLNDFCVDKAKLSAFWDQALANLMSKLESNGQIQ